MWSSEIAEGLAMILRALGLNYMLSNLAIQVLGHWITH